MKTFFSDYFKAKFLYNWFDTLWTTTWFTKSWYQYLFEKPCNIRTIICRARGHAGVIFYNPSGSEPDMTCKFCDDDLDS